MKVKLAEWAKADYRFNLDWLLRSVNTTLTGEAKFQYLHDKSAEDLQDGLKRAIKHIDTSLNLIGGPAGAGPRPGLLRPFRCAGNGALPRPVQRPDE